MNDNHVTPNDICYCAICWRSEDNYTETEDGDYVCQDCCEETQ